MAGAGYVLSGDILADLYIASLYTKLVPVEDAFITGKKSQKGWLPTWYITWSDGRRGGILCGVPCAVVILPAKNLETYKVLPVCKLL